MVVIDTLNQKESLSASSEELKRLLQRIEEDILPLTKVGVEKGNKVFGAALLDKNLDLIVAETNNEIANPLFHGEVNLINKWARECPPADRGSQAQSSIFLSTHEPCCMCMSSIVWAGFTKVFYLFPYSITSDQGIPHDIKTMHELWGVETYRKQNFYCSTVCIMDLIEALPNSNEKNELLEKQQYLVEIYSKLSQKYHTEKESNRDNSLVLC